MCSYQKSYISRNHFAKASKIALSSCVIFRYSDTGKIKKYCEEQHYFLSIFLKFVAFEVTKQTDES